MVRSIFFSALLIGFASAAGSGDATPIVFHNYPGSIKPERTLHQLMKTSSPKSLRTNNVLTSKSKSKTNSNANVLSVYLARHRSVSASSFGASSSEEVLDANDNNANKKPRTRVREDQGSKIPESFLFALPDKVDDKMHFLDVRSKMDLKAPLQWLSPNTSATPPTSILHCTRIGTLGSGYQGIVFNSHCSWSENRNVDFHTYKLFAVKVQRNMRRRTSALTGQEQTLVHARVSSNVISPAHDRNFIPLLAASVDVAENLLYTLYPLAGKGWKVDGREVDQALLPHATRFFKHILYSSHYLYTCAATAHGDMHNGNFVLGARNNSGWRQDPFKLVVNSGDYKTLKPYLIDFDYSVTGKEVHKDNFNYTATRRDTSSSLSGLPVVRCATAPLSVATLSPRLPFQT